MAANDKGRRRTQRGSDQSKYPMATFRWDPDLRDQAEARRKLEERGKSAFLRNAVKFYLRHAPKIA